MYPSPSYVKLQTFQQKISWMIQNHWNVNSRIINVKVSILKFGFFVLWEFSLSISHETKSRKSYSLMKEKYILESQILVFTRNGYF